MGWLKDTQVNTYKLKPMFWKIYIDDIFIIWQLGSLELEKTLNTKQ